MHRGPWTLPRPTSRLGALLLAMTILVVADTAALAVTLDVDSVVDAVDAVHGDGLCATEAGDCTLRAALQESSSITGRVTINVPAGTYELSGGPLSVACDGFDCDGTVSIVGSPPAASIIDGGGSGTLFEVARPVTVSDLWLRNASVGVSSEYTTVAANGVVITATDSAVVMNSGGASAFTDCLIAGNGRGIYAKYTALTIASSTFDDNGDVGVQVDPGVIRMTSTTVTHHAGPGIDCYGEGEITDSTIANNVVGIRCHTLDVNAQLQGLTVAASSITDNVQAGLSSIDSVLTVRDTTVAHNGACGVIVDGDGGSLDLERAAVHHNQCGIFLGTGPDGYVAHISDAEISDNAAEGVFAGGVAQYPGELVIERTRMSRNKDSGFKYDAFNCSDPAMLIRSSTIDDNASEGNGAGIALVSSSNCNAPTLHVVNSTLSGNHAAGSGGAVHVGTDDGTVTFHNVTIVDNVADATGGAIANPSTSVVRVENSLLARNRAGGTPSVCDGTIAAARYDIADSSFDCTITGENTGNTVVADAAVGPLRDVGGPLPTRALLAGSAAIDAGDPDGCRDDEDAPVATDERGVARPQFARCDVGAFEFACGNGTVDLGETCDDGNIADGDCCSANCEIEPAAACGNPATPTATPTATTTPTPTTTPISLCAATPRAGCKTPSIARKAALTIHDTTPDKNDTLTWRWLKGAPTSKTEFGAPDVTTDYALCIYDGGSAGQPRLTAEVPAGGTCGTRRRKPCWKPTRNGFEYKDSDGASNGVRSIVLQEGATPGKAQITVQAKGVALPIPSPSSLVPPVTVQLVNNDGHCWEATYSSSNSSARHEASEFKGKAY